MALNFANIYSLKVLSRNLSHAHGNICCLPDQGHFGHYINNSTETGLCFFIKYLLTRILLTQRHLLLLILVVVVVAIVVVAVEVVLVAVGVVILLVAVEVVLKYLPGLVNINWEP